jgi:hypothetical protein
MKNVFVLSMIGMALTSCTSSENADLAERKVEYAQYIDNPTEISFDEMDYNFGTVKDGEMVNHTFKFKNTGDQNLILLGVTGSCGCTVPEDWPKHPIAPGETGEIDVVFNSSGRVGNVLKHVSVEANTNPTVSKLSIIGVVTE